MSNKKVFSVSEALKFGFSKFIEHFLFFIKIIFAKFGISLLAMLSILGLFMLPIKIFENISVPRFILSCIVCGGLLGFVYVFLELGAVRIALDIYDKNSSKLSQLFPQLSKAWTAFLAFILYVAICMVGLLFFIVPGIFFIVMFSLYEYVIIDQNKGAIESLRESYRLVSKHKMSVFILVCMLTLLYLVSGPLLIFMVMIGKLIYAFVYKRVKSSEQCPEAYAPYDM